MFIIRALLSVAVTVPERILLSSCRAVKYFTSPMKPRSIKREVRQKFHLILIAVQCNTLIHILATFRDKWAHESPAPIRDLGALGNYFYTNRRSYGCEPLQMVKCIQWLRRTALINILQRLNNTCELDFTETRVLTRCVHSVIINRNAFFYVRIRCSEYLICVFQYYVALRIANTKNSTRYCIWTSSHPRPTYFKLTN